MKLLLWDIDGTLMYSGGVAGECMRAAVAKVYGKIPSEERHQYAGKTDRQILLEAFPDRDQAELLALLEPFTQAYLAELNHKRAEFLSRGRVLAGVREALIQLTDQAVVQSTLTGNLAAIAHYKLELMGLAQYINLEVGAYGSDHHERARLPAIAVQRANQRYNQAFSGNDVVVIGDTPNDIACGKAFGARTIAVASGPFSVEELAAHHPDAVLPNLEQTAQVIEVLLK